MRFSKLTLTLGSTLAAIGGTAPADSFFGSLLGIGKLFAQCGTLMKVEEEGVMPVYGNGHYENLEVATHMISFDNLSCGIGMVFRERDARGDVMWSGGPGDYVGADKAIEARQAIEIANTPIEARHAEQIPNDSADPRYHCFYEGEKFFSALKIDFRKDTEKNSVMAFFNNQKCGFCIVFKERGAQSGVLWSDGPTDTDAAKGGQSYWCY